MDWAEVHANLLASTKQRMKGLEDLQTLIKNEHVLTSDQLHDLVDAAGDLLADANHKVCQITLTVLNAVVQRHADSMKPYTGVLVPLVVEKLGDSRQPVRMEASTLIQSMMANLPISIIMEKMSRAWSHRHWKVKHGVLQTLAEAISTGALELSDNPDLRDHIVTSAVNQLEDKDEHVRDAAQDLLQEMYKDMGGVLLDNLQQQSIRPAVLRDLINRLDEVSPTNITVPSEHAMSFNLDPSMAAYPEGAAPAAAQQRATVGKRPASAPTGPPAPPAPVEAPPVVVSERELHAELAAMATPLSGTVVDWQQRIQHMQRLQALATGCPQHMHDTLLDVLKSLKDPLTTQVEDRRSAVSKQACQLLSALSATLGLRFEPLLTHFLPVLSKVLPITVQVMAEAADACCQSLLATCPSPRAVGLLSQGVLKDKNAKIRSFCAGYLADVIQSWDPNTLARCTDDLEAAMRVACQDSAGEARASARRMYSGYCAALPDQAQQFARHLAPALLEKLSMGASKAAAPPSRRTVSKPSFSRPSSSSSIASCATDPDIIVMAPPQRTHSAMPAMTSPAGGGGATATRQGASAPIRVAVPSVQMPAPLADKQRPAAVRRAIAARVPGALLMDQSLDAPTALAALQLGPDSVRPAAPKARRASISHYHTPHQPQGAPQRIPATPALCPGPRPADREPTPTYHHTSAPGNLMAHDPTERESVGSMTGRGFSTAAMGQGGGLPPHAPQAKAPPTVARLTAALLSGQKPWNEKVDLLAALSEALRALARGDEFMADSVQSLPADPTRDLEKLVPKLMESIDEAHVKVAVAGLTALADAVAACPHALEHSLDRILPSVFIRQQDSKDAVRVAATRLLHEVAGRFASDQLLPGLLRALDSNKQARVKQAIIEFGAQAMATGPTRNHHTSHPASSTLLKQWLRAASVLLTDKNHDLRRAAGEAVRAAHTHMDAESVVAYARHSTGAEGLALKRLLSDLEAENTSSTSSDLALPPNVTGRTQSSVIPGPNSSTAWGHSPAASHASASLLVQRSIAPGSDSKAANGPRSYPLDLPVMDVPGTNAHSTSGLQLHCQQAAAPGVQLPQPIYTPQGYMSPYKAPDMPKLSSSGPQHPSLLLSTPSLSSDLGTSLLEEQGAYAVVAPLTRPTTTAMLALAAPTATTTLDNVRAVSSLGQQYPSSGMYSSSSGSVAGVGVAAGQLSVPSDQAGQVRTLHLAITRLRGAGALEALPQLEALCMHAKVSSSAWLQRGPNLVTELVTQVLPSPTPALREGGVRLLATLARHQPQLFTSPPPGLMEELLPGLMQCSAAFGAQTNKCVLETLDTLLDVVPLSKALSVLAAQLQQHSASGQVAAVAQGVCAALQRVMGRMTAEQLAVALPEHLLTQLQACAQDGQLEERKAAVYALAQMKLTLGEARFAQHAGLLAAPQLQLVEWAYSKLKEASILPRN